MNNTSNKIRKITDGAIITAIYAVFFLASRFIGGLLEGYLYFLIPIPIAIYGYKYDIIGSISTLVASVVVSFLFISNPINVVIFVLPGLIGGCVYPLLLKKNIKTSLEVLFLSLISLIVNVFSSVIFASFFNYDLIQDTLLIVDEMMNILSNFGIDFISYTFIKSIMISLIPATFIITAIVEGFVIYLLTHMVLIRLKMENRIKMVAILKIENTPSFVAFIYIFYVVLMVFSIFNLVSSTGILFIIYSIILNLGIIFSYFMAYQGIFYIAKYSKVYNMRWLYILFVLLTLFIPIFSVIIGVFQNIFHLSKKL